MDELLELGLNETEIKDIITTNPQILKLTNKEITDLINILKQINCKDYHIKNIITANPFYLSRSKEDIIKLIKKLLSLNISNLEITFDTNPWLLNKDSYEIDEYIKEELQKKKTLTEIIDTIESGKID